MSPWYLQRELVLFYRFLYDALPCFYSSQEKTKQTLWITFSLSIRASPTCLDAKREVSSSPLDISKILRAKPLKHFYTRMALSRNSKLNQIKNSWTHPFIWTCTKFNGFFVRPSTILPPSFYSVMSVSSCWQQTEQPTDRLVDLYKFKKSIDKTA